MLVTHKGMNIDGDEFIAVLDDALEAKEKKIILDSVKKKKCYLFFTAWNQKLLLFDILY